MTLTPVQQVAQPQQFYTLPNQINQQPQNIPPRPQLTWNFNNNNNHNAYDESNNPFINMLGTNALSAPPKKAYDIIPDIWNAPAKVTIGELLSNDEYRNDLRTALNTIENYDVNEIKKVETTALAMKVKINGQLVDVTPDSGAALSVISQGLAKKLKLNITPVQENDLRALNSNVRVVGAVEQAPIQIQQAKIPIDLRVVNTGENTLLLGMDWFKKYQVTLDVPNEELTFITQGQRFQTKVTNSQQQKTVAILTRHTTVEAEEWESSARMDWSK